MKSKYIILFMFLLSITVNVASAETFEVGYNQTYTSIGSAVNAASSGDEIHINEGDYLLTESVIIDKPITIYGDGYEETMIYSNDKSDFASNSNPAMFVVDETNNVEIYGIMFRGPASSLDDIHDEDQTYHGGADEYHSAIKVVGSNNVKIHDCYATLLLSDFVRMTDGESSDVDIHNNIVDTCGHDCVQAWYADGLHVYNNYFKVFINCGVRLANTQNCVVEYNTFTSASSSGWCGVEIENSHSNDTIRHNLFTDMKDNVAIATVGSSASGCTINNNAGYKVPNGITSGFDGAKQYDNIVFAANQDWKSLGYGCGSYEPVEVEDPTVIPFIDDGKDEKEDEEEVVTPTEENETEPEVPVVTPTEEVCEEEETETTEATTTVVLFIPNNCKEVDLTSFINEVEDGDYPENTTYILKTVDMKFE